HEEREFEDREHKARPLVDVRGQNVFVIQSLHADEAQSANDKLLRLLFFIGALKDASAAGVTALVPYLCYARKDRKTQPNDPVTTQYVARLFEAVGTDCLVSLDVHNLAAYQNAFRCRSEHLEANDLFVRHFAPQLANDEVIVISPDAGGIKRAERFRQALGATLQRPIHAGFAEKYRAKGVVSGEMVIGDIEGKIALIIDDLISTGGTIARVAKVCRERGAKQVFAIASHGLFVDPASTVLAGEALDQTVVTNSVPPFRVTSQAAHAKLLTLDCSPLFAEAIRLAQIPLAV
ncbi:MAG: ribose-phosphate diphosphokinase, partial [Burkholderiaceae bacterium]|nr:ribose-phosphate diphosphokinase [Burkholderiaceae bacterium]